MIVLLLSWLNAFIFLVIAAFHYYWALGGRYGFSVVLPEVEHSGKKAFIPGPLATAVVATVFLSIAFLYKGWLPLPPGLNRAGLWMIAGITCLRAIGDFRYVGFFKKKSSTAFAVYDNRYFSPLCLYLALSTAFMLLRP